MDTEQTRDITRAAIDAFGSDTFLPTDDLIKRIMANSNGDEWWFRQWRTPRAAAMSLATHLNADGIHSVRSSVNGMQRTGYFRKDLTGEATTEWWH